MPSPEKSLQRQKELKTQIQRNLDILIGSVVRSPSMTGWCLTDKIRGRTVTRYVRKRIVSEARRMSRQCQRLWKLLRQLSEVNWRLLRYQAK
jgi:hypothetical protein